MENTKPKIVIFSLAYDPFVGGAEVAIAELTKRLQDRYEFHVVTARVNRDLPIFEDKGYIKVHRIGISKPGATINDFSAWPLKLNKLLYPWLAFWTARRLHRKHDFAAQWCMLPFLPAVSSLLFKLTNPSVPYLLEMQDGRSYAERRQALGLLFPLVRRSFAKADRIKTISTFQIDVAKEMGAAAPALRIPNGVDTTIFTANISDTDKETVRQKLNLSKENTYLITATRLVTRRGHEALIGSLAHLPDTYQLILCGTGPHEENLRSLAKELNIENRVIFAGNVDYADLPTYLSVADVFVRPSIFEGMGNSFIEAFAFGIPVVGTPVGGIIDFLFDGTRNTHPQGLQTGYICNVDDPEDVAKQVKAVFANPEEAAMRVAAAKELALKEYGWDLIAKRMDQEIWHPLLSDSPSQ